MEEPSDRNRGFARRSRGTLTDTETELWRLLRNRRLHSIKFRRQVPIGPYVADFACHALKLVIEADGGGLIQDKAERGRGDASAWPG